ncbi:MAG: alkaline phosphatase family protein [Candidatus Eremiobacteraeota bacterium]|nr:alkaline phosphatase family protein [Candidatus Eremiobacteraeota bacterium]
MLRSREKTTLRIVRRALGPIACAAALLLGEPASAERRLPRPAHVVVIVEENKSLAEIVGNGRAPFINSVAKRGALFTESQGVTHPSLPNYLALFAGLTNDNGDGCPATGVSHTAPNLASELLAAHLTFGGYAEGLPASGSSVCAAGTYARKHAPWVEFTNVPASVQQPFAHFPNYARLPTVAFVVPNVDDDMHDGSIAAGDDWLVKNLGRLVAWAESHDTLVVLTWDEGYDARNTIPTIFFGPMVRPGRYSQPITHYEVLRTLETMYGLQPTGKAAAAMPIGAVWKTP